MKTRLNSTRSSRLRTAFLSAFAMGVVSLANAADSTWNGGGNPNFNWNVAANWGGTAPVAVNRLFFAGTTGLNATNNFAPDTVFSNITFNAGAGAFNLQGATMSFGTTAAGGLGITNNSSNPQSVGLGLKFAQPIVLNGGASGLAVSALTNTISGNGAPAVTLAGTGTLTNMFNRVSTPGGTNLISMTAAGANWTLVDNAASTPILVPWIWQLNNGTFNFGTASSAPILTIAGSQGVTADSQMGSGANTVVFNFANGTLTNSSRVNTVPGTGGSVTINMTGGLWVHNGQFQAGNTAGSGTTTLNVSSGTLNVSGGTFFLASRAVGVLNLSSVGQVLATTFDVSRVASAGTKGTVNLDGGTLSVNQISTSTANGTTANATETATVNYNGGLLKARQNNANFITQNAGEVLLTQVVKAGGAIIDTVANNVTNTLVMQHDAGLGGTPDGGLTKLGSGILGLTAANTYTGPTIVTNGTIIAGVANAIPSASAVTVDAVGTLNIGANNQSVGAVTLNNGTISGTSGALTATSFSVKNGSISAILAGSGVSLTKTTAGLVTLSGANTYNGSTLVNAGALALSGSGGIAAGSPILVNNAVLDLTAKATYGNANDVGIDNSGTLNLGNCLLTALNSLSVTNSTVTFAVSASLPTNIIVGNLTTAGTTNVLNITAVPGLPTYPTQYTLIKYTTIDPNLVDGNNNLTTLGVALPTLGSPVGYITNNTVKGSIDLVLSSGPVPVVPITWSGAVNGNWNILTTANWVTTSDGVTPYQYQDTSDVTFDDSASGSTTVNVTTTVIPNSLVVSNTVKDYTLNGSGKLSGAFGLNKLNGGKLTLADTGGDNYTGGINVNGGTVVIDNNSGAVTGGTTIASGTTVQVGNNDTSGVLPTGGVANSGSLVLVRTDSNTVANVISGNGTVTQNSGINKLTGANTYSGSTLISGGTLWVGNAGQGTGNSALGVIPGGSVTITNGGTLDVGGNATANQLGFTNGAGGAKQFFIAGNGVGGNGAIVNNGSANQQNVFQFITLTADSKWGGAGRFDMRGNGIITPVLDLQGFTLTKEGSSQMSMVNLVVTNAGNIIINNGILSFETTSSNATTHITVNSGGVLGHFRENATLFTAPITLNGGMIRDLNGTPGSTNDSPITLTADSFLDLNVGSTDLLRLNGIISDSGGSYGLTKTNGGTFALAGVNTYGGNTYVAQGKLALIGSGSIANSANIIVAGSALFDVSGCTSTFGLSSGQVLTNNSSTAVLNGSATSGSGVIALRFASGTPAFTVTNGTLTLSASTTFRVFNTGAPLAPGNYKIISKATAGNVGSVAGTLPAVTVNGGGIGAGQHATLSLTSGELFLNVFETPPSIANTVTNAVSSGLSWRMAVTDLATAAGWGDADGDTVTLSQVGPTSNLGTSVTTGGGFIFYNGPVTAEDFFSYIVTDGTLTATNKVYLEVLANAPTYNITVTNAVGGQITLNGASIPGRTNVIERTTNLTQPITWTPINTNVVGPNGLWQFTDPAPSNPSYYRAVTQP